MSDVAKENWISDYIFFSGQQWGDQPPTREDAEREWSERQQMKITGPLTDEMRREFSKPDGVIEIIAPCWRPIATAPKDGTRILVWDSGCEIVSWRHDQNNHAWWRTLTGAWFDPKFWMPLPVGPMEKVK